MTTTLVTGATRGLGREVAARLVDAGHTVYLGARDEEQGRRVAAELGARAIQLDVTDDGSVARAAAQLTDAGGLDVLVNNAGIAGLQRPPAQPEVADLRALLATNVVGATAVLWAMTPLLDASDAPVVVNVTSAVGSLGLNAKPDSAWSLLAYPMSKTALNMLTIQYARAFPRWRVNAATPGLTRTEFTANPSGRGHSVEHGAEILVRMACLGPDGPTGTYVGEDGEIPW